MLDQQLRNHYEKIVITPLLPFLKSCKPHLLTLFGLITGIAVCPLIVFSYPWLAVSFLFLSGLFDTLDGSCARLQEKSSARGAVFDIVADRIVEFFVILGLFLIAPYERGLLCMLMLGSVLLCVTSFLVVGIFSENASEKSFHYSPGLMERAEAFVFFAIMIVFPGSFYLCASTFVLLTVFTAALRCMQFYRFSR